MDVVTVNKEIAEDDNDYLPELIAILNKTEYPSFLLDDDDLDDGPPQFTELEYKKRTHLIIYSFLALSIVMGDQGDVAAVAVYQLSDKIQVYYSKNLEITEACKSHVEALSSLVRNVAEDHSITKELFIEKYFTLIHRNCFKKFHKRLKNFKYYILMKSGSGDSNQYVSSLHYLIQTYSNKNANLEPSCQADFEAASLSPTGNVYDGFARILDTIVSKVSSISSVRDYYIKVSHYAYVFGHSSIMDRVRKNRPEFHSLIENAKKLGEYFRGARHLYKTMTVDSNRARFTAFTVTPVEMEGIAKKKLKTDWYHILQVVYYRYTHEPLSISANGFIGHCGWIREYEEHTKQEIEFVFHCEVKLILYLMKLHLPTTLGISKSSARCVMNLFMP